VPAKALDLLAGQSYDGDVEVTAGARHLFFVEPIASYLVPA